MSKVKWAVVGTSGFALDWIARGISLGSNAELTAVVSRDEQRGRAGAERVGAPHHFTSVETIDRNVVDAVFVVTPNPVHAPLTIAAAQRGLHVAVEKPMAATRAECQSMIDAAKASGVVLAVAHCMHWAPPVARARELVAEGAIGKVIQATIGSSYNSPPSSQWRQTDPTEAGGGPLYDMGIHAIDALQAIVGPVARVAAFCDHHIYDYPAEDTNSTLLRFASGAHGVMQTHGNCAQNNFEIIGTAGQLRSDEWLGRDFAGHLVLRRGGDEVAQDLTRVNVYVPQIEHISNCILNRSEPEISGERGLRNVAVVQAAVESARSGRSVAVAQEGA